jgi:hypothetical protein
LSRFEFIVILFQIIFFEILILGVIVQIIFFGSKRKEARGKGVRTCCKYFI